MARMWRKRNTPPLLVGLQAATTTLEISLVVPKKIDRISLYFCTPDFILIICTLTVPLHIPPPPNPSLHKDVPNTLTTPLLHPTRSLNPLGQPVS